MNIKKKNVYEKKKKKKKKLYNKNLNIFYFLLI